MEKINSHKQIAGTSPRLIRSRSGSPAISFPDSSPSVPLNRSKSSGKYLKITSTEKEKLYPKKKLVAAAVEDDSAKFLQRNRGKIEVPRRARSASTSPSAWALSPGRLAPPPVQVRNLVPKSPVITTSGKKLIKSKGVSGVLNFFRQKKISPLHEEEYHQFRILHDRLLQWRFANARAEVSMMVAKRKSEKKLFNVWARMAVIRKLVAEKRIQMQKLKQEIKISIIVGSQMYMLKEWGRLESKSFEAVGRVARKLTAISTCLPLLQGAKADTTPLHDTMCMAMGIMEGIEATITPIQSQMEKTCYLLTELAIVMNEEMYLVNKLQRFLATVTFLEAAESSLKAQCVQLIS